MTRKHKGWIAVTAQNDDAALRLAQLSKVVREMGQLNRTAEDELRQLKLMKDQSAKEYENSKAVLKRALEKAQAISPLDDERKGLLLENLRCT